MFNSYQNLQHISVDLMRYMFTNHGNDNPNQKKLFGTWRLMIRGYNISSNFNSYFFAEKCDRDNP